MIDLEPFCAKDKFRMNILTPWNQGGYTFASDGRVIVRVDEQEVPEVSGVNRTNGNLILESHIDVAKWISIKNIEPEMHACTTCAGKGHGPFVCDECDGAGETECYHCGQDSHCDACNGLGEYGAKGETCPECEGKKEVEWPYGSETPAGNISSTYLRLCNTLPNCQFGITQKFAPEGIIPFRFDYGIGCVMPIRPTEEIAERLRMLHATALDAS